MLGIESLEVVFEKGEVPSLEALLHNLIIDVLNTLSRFEKTSPTTLLSSCCLHTFVSPVSLHCREGRNNIAFHTLQSRET